jgi:PAS domain-containing protein
VSQKEIEVILIRQLASCLAMPMFIVDERGNLLFYNEPAEKILGRRFEETGEMSATEWATAWTPTDESGAPLPPEAQPLTIAFRERRPVHGRMWIRGLDNVQRLIEATCFPLIGQAQRYLGAVAITWQIEARD